MQASPPEVFFSVSLVVLVIIALALLLSVALFAFWIWSIVDVAQHEPTDLEKLIWLVVIIFTSVIGSFIYLLVRRPERIRQVGH